ncbi:MAG TPA: hypothetical protein VFV50_14585, partial [Bdellovibrionales bacterium]|nr:hypothetical protein [Bdellovibrionales bacterium]
TGSFLNVLLKGRKREEFKWFNFAANAPLVSMDGAKAARKIVRAMEARRSLLVLGWKAKLPRIVFALSPRATLWALTVMDRMLPAPPPGRTLVTDATQGKLLRMELPNHAPKRLGEKAAVEYNQTFEKRGAK